MAKSPTPASEILKPTPCKNSRTSPHNAQTGAEKRARRRGCLKRPPPAPNYSPSTNRPVELPFYFQFWKKRRASAPSSRLYLLDEQGAGCEALLAAMQQGRRREGPDTRSQREPG